MSQRQTLELLPDDIKSALDHLDAIEFLETSKLSGLQYVLLHSNNGAFTPAHKRGALVRDLFKKAFEQMKPEGNLRSDAAQIGE